MTHVQKSFNKVGIKCVNLLNLLYSNIMIYV
nr:MAG TPA: hypothetical protein [Caudoviricetes sp.]DAS30913.1 MAG TPA: hypothetical protein [Caudoviricetes sp.]DAW11124.1 MAG TPA: hypothetical protein [Caudoviricetes sp.]